MTHTVENNPCNVSPNTIALDLVKLETWEIFPIHDASGSHLSRIQLIDRGLTTLKR
jgi:hypothetical protein